MDLPLGLVSALESGKCERSRRPARLGVGVLAGSLRPPALLPSTGVDATKDR